MFTTSVLSTALLINSVDLSYAQTSNPDVVLFTIVNNPDGSSTYAIHDNPNNTAIGNNDKARLIGHLHKKVAGSFSKRELKREKAKDSQARKIIHSAQQQAARVAAAAAAAAAIVTPPVDQDTDTEESVDHGSDDSASDNTGSGTSGTSNESKYDSSSLGDENNNVLKTLELRRDKAVKKKQAKAALKKEARQKKNDKHDVANPFVALMLKNSDKKESCAKAVEQLIEKNSLRLPDLRKSRAAPLALPPVVVEASQPPQAEFTFSSPRTMSLDSNSSTPPGNLGWNIPSDGSSVESLVGSPVLDSQSTSSIFNLLGKGIEEASKALPSANDDDYIRDREFVELDISESETEAGADQEDVKSTSLETIAEQIPITEDIVMTDVSSDKETSSADDDKRSAPIKSISPADTWVATVLAVPNTQQYPTSLSADEQQKLVSIHVTPLPPIATTKKVVKSKKLAAVATKSPGVTPATAQNTTVATMTPSKSWVSHFLAVPDKAEHPQNLSLDEEASLVELHVAPLPVPAPQKKSSRQDKKASKARKPAAKASADGFDEPKMLSKPEIIGRDEPVNASEELQLKSFMSPAHAANEPTTSSCGQDHALQEDSADLDNEKLMFVADHTFISTITLSEFLVKLPFDLNTGKISKHGVSEAFTAVCIEDCESLKGSSPSDSFFDVNSPAARHRIRLGAISLPKFMDMVAFDGHGTTQIKLIIDAFNKAAQMDEEHQKKLSKLAALAKAITGSS